MLVHVCACTNWFATVGEGETIQRKRTTQASSSKGKCHKSFCRINWMIFTKVCMYGVQKSKIKVYLEDGRGFQHFCHESGKSLALAIGSPNPTPKWKRTIQNLTSVSQSLPVASSIWALWGKNPCVPFSVIDSTQNCCFWKQTLHEHTRKIFCPRFDWGQYIFSKASYDILKTLSLLDFYSGPK